MKRVINAAKFENRRSSRSQVNDKDYQIAYKNLRYLETKIIDTYKAYYQKFKDKIISVDTNLNSSQFETRGFQANLQVSIVGEGVIVDCKFEDDEILNTLNMDHVFAEIGNEIESYMNNI